MMLLVMAGKAVDDFISALLPFTEEGDIIIDGGNSSAPVYLEGRRVPDMALA